MIARALIALCALLIVTGAAVAQDPAPAVEYTLPRSAEETLVNALPISDNVMLTIKGERLMRRTMLKLVLTDASGAPLPADTPVTLTLDALLYSNTTDGEPNPMPLDSEVVWQDGAWYVGPYRFDAPGYLAGEITVGNGAGDPVAFEIGIFPNAPEVPGWFAPVNVVVPFAVLAVIVGVLMLRRVPLTRRAAA